MALALASNKSRTESCDRNDHSRNAIESLRCTTVNDRTGLSSSFLGLEIQVLVLDYVQGDLQSLGKMGQEQFINL